MKVEFRRNHYNGGKGGFQKNRILIFIVVLLGLFLAFSLNYKPKPIGRVVQSINIKVLNDDKIIVQDDTTNFDNFASILKKEISKGKKNKKVVKVNIPKNKKAGQFLDLIQIINAFENVELKLTVEN